MDVKSLVMVINKMFIRSKVTCHLCPEAGRASRGPFPILEPPPTFHFPWNISNKIMPTIKLFLTIIIFLFLFI
jgi:hypothetical protein